MLLRVLVACSFSWLCSMPLSGRAPRFLSLGPVDVGAGELCGGLFWAVQGV